MTGQHGDKLRTMFRRPPRGRPATLLAAPAPAASPEPETISMPATAAIRGRGADGSPLVRDAIGVRPATAGEIYEHRAEFQAMGFTFGGGWDTPAAREEAAVIFGPGAHGIATPGTLAAIREEAARQIASLDPDDPDATAWHRAELSRLNRPYTDPDPTMIDVSAARWEPPVSAGESAARMARLTYPPANGTREQYAALSRQVSAYTGTRSPKEQPSAWEPVFRTGGDLRAAEGVGPAPPAAGPPCGNEGSGMSLLNLFRPRRTEIPPEPDGPWAVLDAVFYSGRAVPPVAVTGTPYFAGTQAGPDGRLYADICIGTGPDAITSLRTHSGRYCAEMAQAWMLAGDALNPAPAALAANGGAA